MSRSLAPWFALVVGLLLGSLGTWALLDPLPTSTAPPRVGVTDGPARPESPSLEAPAPAIAGGAEAPPELRAPDVDLDTLLRSARAEATSGGDVLRGVVIARDEEVPPGVLIVARPEVAERSQRLARDEGRPSELGSGAPPSEPWQDEVRDRAHHAATAAANERRTRTDSSGAFVLEGLPEGYLWELRAYRLDWEFEVETGVRPHPDHEVELEGTPVRSVEVEVRLPGGALAERAVLHSTLSPMSGEGPLEGYGGQLWTRAEPYFRARVGQHSVLATAGEWLPGTPARQALLSEPVDLDVAADGHGPVVLQLAERPVLTGRLLRGGEVVTRGFTVALHALTDEGTVVRRASIQDGHFQILDPEPGEYVLTARIGSRGQVVDRVPVQVERGRVVQDLEIPALSDLDLVAVHVTDSTGRPITHGLRVRLASGGRFSVWARTVHPVQEKGSVLYFDFPGQVAGRRSERYWVDVATDRHGLQRFSWSVEDREVTCMLVEPIMVQAQVVGVEHALADGVELSLSVRGIEGTVGGGTHDVGAKGRVELGPLTPGRYTVRLESKGDAAGVYQGTLSVQEVHWRDDTTQRIPVPPLAEVHVRAGPGVTLSDVEILRLIDDGPPLHGRAKARAEDGLVRLTGLPLGKYSLSGGGIRRTIDLPCGEVVLDK